MSTEKRVRITSDRLNAYGSRVLTRGLDISQYEHNPVLLYMHQRGDVIGYVKDIEKTPTEVTGVLVFDEATELSRRCKQQWAVGSLRMVSAGLDILETSSNPEDLTDGQTHFTVSKSRLFEVSLVDIGANDDAIVLRQDGELLPLSQSHAAHNPLPLIEQPTPHKHMETSHTLQELALSVGLDETATPEAVKAAVQSLLGRLEECEEQLSALRETADALRLSRIEGLVDTAIAEHRLAADRKAQFMELGKEIGDAKLVQTLEAMQPTIRLSRQIQEHGKSETPKTERKLFELTDEEVRGLRQRDAEEYCRLYKAEYGFPPETLED